MNKEFFFYSSLAFPLSFIGIPIYVYIADFYITSYQISFGLVGILIFLSRFIDVIEDPFIGYLSDWLSKRGFSRKKIITIAAPFLAISFYYLFNPLEIFINKGLMPVWFVLMLILVYSFFSVIVINYNAIATILPRNYLERSKIVSMREFVGLFGIITASILPSIISMTFSVSQNMALQYLGMYFAIILILFIFVFYFFLKDVDDNSKENYSSKRGGIKNNFLEIFSVKEFRVLLLIFFINSIAVSIPASTFIFFVDDVLESRESMGLFLLTYFCSAAFAMSIWNYSVKKIGKTYSWIISIVLSIMIFFLAFFLNKSNSYLFYFICCLSGIMLGADLSIPPSILADIISKNNKNSSSFFSIWNMASKLALAFASGAALIFLDISNYQNNGDSNFYLSFVYAIIPCFIKIIVVILLFFSKIDKNQNY